MWSDLAADPAIITRAQRVHLPIQFGADSIIQVGSDSLLLCSVIYKFWTTNTFHCHDTIALIFIQRIKNLSLVNHVFANLSHESLTCYWYLTFLIFFQKLQDIHWEEAQWSEWCQNYNFKSIWIRILVRKAKMWLCSNDLC